MPYGKWSSSLPPPSPSPLQGAISQAINDATPQDPCYIDILHLADQGQGGTVRFFEPIIKSIVDFIKSGSSGGTPVIRYLVGDTERRPPQDSGFMSELYKTGGFSAHVFYGNFVPSFQLSAQLDGFSPDRLVEAVHSWIAGVLPTDYQSEVKRLFAGLPDWATFPQLVKPTSWNHAKIFALNGSQLVTGGGNYWSEYSQGETVLFDLSMRMGGDAAIDAHKYANYLWGYLSDIPKTDTYSCSYGNYTNDLSKFEPSNKAPLLTDFPTNSGSTPALTVSRIGNWPSQTGYPLQVVDGIRDFIVNVIAVLAEKNQDDKLTASVVNAVTDENLRDELRKLGISINPAAWASRYARNYAICRAQSHLRLSQQALVMDDLVHYGPQSYKDLVARINEMLGTSWDGYIWPFDTLSALGNALATFSQNPNVPGTVQIVCSAPSEATGYEDPITPTEFRQKLISLMTGMSLMGYIKPLGSISDIVSKRVEYRRVDNTSEGLPPHANHSKLVVVDDTLCYIGSDNLYPGYNEESGIWIDEPQAIQRFVDEYWTGLWHFAVQVNESEAEDPGGVRARKVTEVRQHT
ncbi:MAG TPA: hypothetical protein VFV03_04050 [Solirubrobacteraceae bacterium]|nr:hypothetical protein [Solirubrobacteraceae bacterium]